MTDQPKDVVGGVDTHGDTHVAAVVDMTGRILNTESFPATAPGYRRLLAWLRRHGIVVRVGVEGTGSWGAGLTRHLERNGIEVLDVDRPNRQMRRLRGKSDTVDAEAAARAALNGEATTRPKSRSGPVEALRAFRVARRSALKSRVATLAQLRALIVTAPEPLRAQVRDLDTATIVATAARWRPGPPDTVTAATKTAMRELALRVQFLDDQIDRIDTHQNKLVADTCPELLELFGVGPQSAAALLVAAGDNPERLRSEAGFAALCGVSPVEASSGKTIRHRLSRGGDRQANHALWRIAFSRLRNDERTIAYEKRRTAEGMTRREIIRCLKRYIAREIYYVILRSDAFTQRRAELETGAPPEAAAS